jgi:hypothetical protein
MLRYQFIDSRAVCLRNGRTKIGDPSRPDSEMKRRRVTANSINLFVRGPGRTSKPCS